MQPGGATVLSTRRSLRRRQPISVNRFGQGAHRRKKASRGSTEQPGAGWVGDSFVLSFAAGSRFYYAYHRQGTWSELRGIELSDKVTKSDARLQVEELLRSLDAEPDAVN